MAKMGGPRQVSDAGARACHRASTTAVPMSASIAAFMARPYMLPLLSTMNTMRRGNVGSIVSCR